MSNGTRSHPGERIAGYGAAVRRALVVVLLLLTAACGGSPSRPSAGPSHSAADELARIPLPPDTRSPTAAVVTGYLGWVDGRVYFVRLRRLDETTTTGTALTASPPADACGQVTSAGYRIQGKGPDEELDLEFTNPAVSGDEASFLAARTDGSLQLAAQRGDGPPVSATLRRATFAAYERQVQQLRPATGCGD